MSADGTAIRVGHDRLTETTREIFLAAGCSAEEADAIARHLVDANLTGHDSHGVCKIPEYVGAILAGKVPRGESGEVIVDAGALLVYDGRRGIGQVVARRALELGMARARASGVALVGLKRAHHIGRIGAWAELAAEAGLVSIHFVNVVGHAPYVAPFGGSDGRLATNPVCIGFPATGRPPIILDFATSKVAWGKLLVASNKGEEAPAEAVIDHEGRSTRDPGVMFRAPAGAMLPFGEHKGSGLAFVCELLAGALTGGGTNQPGTPRDDTSLNNMLSILIDPRAMTEGGQFRRELDLLVDYVKQSRRRPGIEEVLVAGEPEQQRRRERLARGIDIDGTTWSEIVSAAARTGLVLKSP